MNQKKKEGCLRTIGGYETHVAADAFPLMEGDAFDELVEDIREHGLREPILLLGRKKAAVIIDGRNRLRACIEAGVEPRFQRHRGPAELGPIVALVRSRNICRRHLSPARAALVAAKLTNMLRDDAAARRRSTQNNDTGRAVSANLRGQDSTQADDPGPAVSASLRGQDPGRANDAGPTVSASLRGQGSGKANDAGRAVSASLRGQDSGKVSELAARDFGVSARSVEHGLVVDRHGVPALQAAINHGGLAISTAAEVARLDPDAQRELLEEAAGAPRSVRRLLRRRESEAPPEPPPTDQSAQTDSLDAFRGAATAVKAHLLRAKEACLALAEAAQAIGDVGAVSRGAAGAGLAAAVDEAIERAERLATMPDLRLVGGASEVE